MQYSKTTLSNFLSSSALVLLLAGCGSSSSDSSNDVVDDNPPPSASVSLSSSNASVSAGASVELTWTSTNATQCSASGSGAWSGSKALSGTETVGPIDQSTTFTMSCSGEGGGAMRQVSVQVDQGNGAVVTLNASPIQIGTGDMTTLNWTASGVDQCTATGAWSGDQGLTGSLTVGPLTVDTTYQLSCDGPSGSAIGLVTVQVLDGTLRWQAPTENVDGSPLTDLAGFNVYWGSSSRNYTGSHPITSAAVTEWEATVAAGSYYFAVTALDSEDNESAYSNEVLKAIP